MEWPRQWMMNVLHNHLKQHRCYLAEFGMNIFPLAGECSRALKAALASSSSKKRCAAGSYAPAQLKAARNRVLQLWSLLPDFCMLVPLDTAASFPKLVKILQ